MTPTDPAWQDAHHRRMLLLGLCWQSGGLAGMLAAVGLEIPLVRVPLVLLAVGLAVGSASGWVRLGFYAVTGWRRLPASSLPWLLATSPRLRRRLTRRLGRVGMHALTALQPEFDGSCGELVATVAACV